MLKSVSLLSVAKIDCRKSPFWLRAVAIFSQNLIDSGPREQVRLVLNMISSSKYTGEDIDLIAGLELPF